MYTKTSRNIAGQFISKKEVMIPFVNKANIQGIETGYKMAEKTFKNIAVVKGPAIVPVIAAAVVASAVTALFVSSRKSRWFN